MIFLKQKLKVETFDIIYVSSKDLKVLILSNLEYLDNPKFKIKVKTNINIFKFKFLKIFKTFLLYLSKNNKEQKYLKIRNQTFNNFYIRQLN